MRISDWSSDVCSSDLQGAGSARVAAKSGYRKRPSTAGARHALTSNTDREMFEQLDALLLARIQFAFTVSFHFIFPSFSIGLASYLAVLEGLWLKTGKQIYLALFKSWIKIFAIIIERASCRKE